MTTRLDQLVRDKCWFAQNWILPHSFWPHRKESSSCHSMDASLAYGLKQSVSHFSCSVLTDFLQPHGLQHTRLICPSPTPGDCSNSCPLSGWCHPTISSSAIPFSSCPQSFPASGSFQMSQLFTSGGQSIGGSASTSVLPMNPQDWFPLGWTGWVSR